MCAASARLAPHSEPGDYLDCMAFDGALGHVRRSGDVGAGEALGEKPQYDELVFANGAVSGGFVREEGARMTTSMRWLVTTGAKTE